MVLPEAAVHKIPSKNTIISQAFKFLPPIILLPPF